MRLRFSAGVVLVASTLLTIVGVANSHSNTRKHYSVSISVADVAAAGLAVNLNGAEQLAVGGAGFFAFERQLRKRDGYVVTVERQPNDRAVTCHILRARGIAAAADIHLTVRCLRNVLLSRGSPS